jgi:hypothetical protein
MGAGRGVEQPAPLWKTGQVLEVVERSFRASWAILLARV